MKKINKITIKGNVKIIETEDKKVVIKKKSKDMNSLFDYLNRRNFLCYPNIEKETRNDVEYEYYNEKKYFNQNDDEDFIRTIADLHYKTTYYKDVSRLKYKDIYNTLIDNIDYLKDYYEKYISEADIETYMSPSNYLFVRNYSIVNSSLFYIEKELNAWYNLVKDKTKERVSVVHNNLRKDNFLRSDKDLLIGWENYMVDTPILDIYKLYKNEYKNIDFKSMFKVYNDTFKLTKEELKLFFIMISMPKKLEKTDNEFNNVRNTKLFIDYMYRTNDFIKNHLYFIK